jgi:hypothetical protein
MPRQQDNSGFKSQNTSLGCRFCFVKDVERDDLQFDIDVFGRYHFIALAMRQEMLAKATKTEREDYAKTWGINPVPDIKPPLSKISPALDIIMSRPGDPAHSEYQGVSRQMHLILMETILTVAGGRLYAAELRKFPFPPNWPRIQSPVKHLKSYSLAEHARWSLVIPSLLRCWLREAHIQKPFWNALLEETTDPISVIVRCYATAAKSNYILMAELLTEEDIEIGIYSSVLNHRTKFQQLLRAASRASTDNFRRHRQASVASARVLGSVSLPSRTTTSAIQSRDATPVHTNQPVPGLGSISVPSAKAVAYERDLKQPNMHTALYYDSMSHEYGIPSNVNVLIGEDKHREVQVSKIRSQELIDYIER